MADVKVLVRGTGEKGGGSSAFLAPAKEVGYYMGGSRFGKNGGKDEFTKGVGHSGYFNFSKGVDFL